MFKLIAENKLDVAFKILKSTEQRQSMDGINLPLGKSFIAHLIRCDVVCIQFLRGGEQRISLF